MNNGDQNVIGHEIRNKAKNFWDHREKYKNLLHDIEIGKINLI